MAVKDEVSHHLKELIEHSENKIKQAYASIADAEQIIDECTNEIKKHESRIQELKKIRESL